MSFRSSKRYTAVQATELMLADSVDDSEPLSDYHLMVETVMLMKLQFKVLTQMLPMLVR